MKSPEQKFSEYAAKYNPEDSQIKLKIVHTFHVLEAADSIAASLSLTRQQAQEVHLAALYHDIGRFEQVRRFHTFTDSRSLPHAALSAQILEEGDFLDGLEPEAKKRIIRAVSVHSDFEVPDDHEGWQRQLDEIVRDADKVDIFRVAWMENSSDTIDPMLITQKPEISPGVSNALEQQRTVLRKDRHTELDFWLSFAAFLFDLNTRQAFCLVSRQGYWKKPLLRWLEEHPEAPAGTVNEILDILHSCENLIDEKIRTD